MIGGTIHEFRSDKTWDLQQTPTVIQDILNQGRNNASVRIIQFLPKLKTSSQMTEEDRDLVAEKCANSQSKMIVLTHGTNGMIETAQKIHSAVKNKTVVLTGSMDPYTMKGDDASFSFGGAIIAVQTLPPGVYICMNGEVFPHDGVEKNKEEVKFQARA